MKVSNTQTNFSKTKSEANVLDIATQVSSDFFSNSRINETRIEIIAEPLTVSGNEIAEMQKDINAGVQQCALMCVNGLLFVLNLNLLINTVWKGLLQ